MTVDLIARNKELDIFGASSFWWSWALGKGVGLPIGAGDGVKPGSYFACYDKYGLDPYMNDGFHVSAKQSVAMSLCATGLAVLERSRKREVLNGTATTDVWIDHLDKFAKWAAQSRGFRVF